MTDKELLLQTIERCMRYSNTRYFESAWQNHLGEFLEEEHKYTMLVEWLNEQIERETDMLIVYNPSDTDMHPYLDDYQDIVAKLGVCIHCKTTLCAKETTPTMRENIEKALVKMYNIHYNETLDCYVVRGK